MPVPSYSIESESVSPASERNGSAVDSRVG